MIERIFKIKSNIKEISPVLKEILSCLKQDRVNAGIIHDIKLATEEAMINAMKYGNKFQEDLPVVINFEYSRDKISISVEDKGKGYDHTKVPDPTLDKNIERGHGRGLFLIKKLMDEIRFNKRGNRIEMVKYL